MVKILRLEKVIFWLFYVFPYLLVITLENITNNYSISLINYGQNTNTNIFSTLYDIWIFVLYGIGLLGIYTYLYDKEFFSKKFLIFIMLILLINDIGRIIYNLDNFLIYIIIFIYFIYYYLTLYRLIRSYNE